MSTSQIESKKKKLKPLNGYAQDLKDDRRVWLGRHENGSWYICFTAPREDGDLRHAAHHKVVKKDGKTLVETRICISSDAIEALISLHGYIKNDGG